MQARVRCGGDSVASIRIAEDKQAWPIYYCFQCIKKRKPRSLLPTIELPHFRPRL
jgi:hypothetical protein